MHPIPQIVSLRRGRRAKGASVALTGLALLALCGEGGAAPTRSTSIALTGNGSLLVNVNHEADSVTLFDVRRGGRGLKKVAEIPTFNAANAIEIRGAGAPAAAAGQGAASLGSLGFNVPSVLSIGFHAPYFHNGAAQTLADVFAQHQLGGGTIQSVLGDTTSLLAFLSSLDGRTPLSTGKSDTDIFRDPNQDL